MSDVERIKGAVAALFDSETSAALLPKVPEFLSQVRSGAGYGRAALEQRIAIAILDADLRLDEPAACGKLADVILTVANPKRPSDVASNAVHIMKVLTGEADDNAPVDDGKDPAAKALGAKGGAARAKAMTPERRSEIAKKAAKSRWNKD